MFKPGQGPSCTPSCSAVLSLPDLLPMAALYGTPALSLTVAAWFGAQTWRTSLFWQLCLMLLCLQLCAGHGHQPEGGHQEDPPRLCHLHRRSPHAAGGALAAAPAARECDPLHGDPGVGEASGQPCGCRNAELASCIHKTCAEAVCLMPVLGRGQYCATRNPATHCIRTLVSGTPR